jgi:SAM-dependent methyltransferase
MSQSLRELFLSHSGRDIYKWEHYFDIYDRHCAALRGNRPVVLEIGVMRGGSLQLWQRYFGEGTSVHGVDINPRCREFAEQGIQVHIGDQGDPDFLSGLGEEVGPFDLVVDDGSHRMEHQTLTMQKLWPQVKNGGFYICEDTHTSYFSRFGGGYRRSDSFIERAKCLVDCLHMWWSGRMSEREAAVWTPHLASVHFYPGMTVLEKRATSPPNAIWNEGGAIRRETPKQLVFDRQEDPTG